MIRPVLLMPKGYLNRLSHKDTEHILLHELAHIKRGDLLMHSLYILLQIIYWYNPLLWLVRRQLHHLRELSCDATVANLLREQTSAYRQRLLETARRFLARSTEPGLGLLGLFEDANRLAIRLSWLEKPTWRYRTMKRITVIALTALMFACVLPMAQGQNNAPVVVEEKTPEAPKQDAQRSRELAALRAKLAKLEAERLVLQKQLAILAASRQGLMEIKEIQRFEAVGETEKAAMASARAKQAKIQAWAEQLPIWTIALWVKSPAKPDSSPTNGPLNRDANYQINWDRGDDNCRGATAVRVFAEVLGPEEIKGLYSKSNPARDQSNRQHSDTVDRLQ